MICLGLSPPVLAQQGLQVPILSPLPLLLRRGWVPPPQPGRVPQNHTQSHSLLPLAGHCQATTGWLDQSLGIPHWEVPVWDMWLNGSDTAVQIHHWGPHSHSVTTALGRACSTTPALSLGFLHSAAEMSWDVVPPSGGGGRAAGLLTREPFITHTIPSAVAWLGLGVSPLLVVFRPAAAPPPLFWPSGASWYSINHTHSLSLQSLSLCCCSHLGLWPHPGGALWQDPPTPQRIILC